MQFIISYLLVISILTLHNQYYSEPATNIIYFVEMEVMILRAIISRDAVSIFVGIPFETCDATPCLMSNA